MAMIRKQLFDDPSRQSTFTYVEAVMEFRSNGSEFCNLYLNATSEEQDKEVRPALLSYGSETEENRKALEGVRLGQYSKRGDVSYNLALGIKDKDISVSDVIYALEQSKKIPAIVKKHCKGITQNEWDSAMRVAYLSLAALETQFFDDSKFKIE